VRPILIPLLERGVRRAVRRHGVSHRFVPTSAGRIHLYDIPGTGDLPTVVMFHGISASGTSFAPLFLRLRSSVKRILVPDYPGHGMSDEPSSKLTLEALFEAIGGAIDRELGTEPFIAIGNSLGGAVALDCVAKRADRTKAVVLLSPAGAQSSDAEWNELVSAFEMRNRRDSVAFMERVYHRVPWPMRLLAHELPANARRRGVTDLFSSVTLESQVPAEELGKLTMPMLFLWGQSERLLPGSHLGWWREHLPKHAVVERPEGMGHCPHVDAPGPLAHRIVSFLRENVRM
jgi:pimeloyl-ACP methyl ester carboxylesterase